MALPEFLQRDADGFIHLTGHRVGIEHLVYFYNAGYTPEMLLGQFPTLSLALIHKVIAYYLENEAEIDQYIGASQTEVDRQRSAAIGGPSVAEMRRRLKAASHAEASGQ